METMRLESIVSLVKPIRVRGPVDVDIEGIAYDSRQVKKNYIFVALRGFREDGTVFIEDAIRRGAVAIVSESDLRLRRSVTHVLVENARRAMAEMSCAFYDHPSDKLKVIGVTGTNGKTTTSFLIHNLLEAEGLAPGLMGTVHYQVGSRFIPATRTTPEAPDVQYLLDQMVRAGCRSAVMEVSSHALKQFRVEGTDFDVGVFTNLTRDHLDYHGTMEDYFEAKVELFLNLGRGHKHATAVVNCDDVWGARLAAMDGIQADRLTYGLHARADVRAENIRVSHEGTHFDLRSPWGSAPVFLQLLGRFNVSNALAAIAAGGALRLPFDRTLHFLGQMRGAPGRLECFKSPRGFRVFVDYAHTEDALQRALETLRELKPRRLIAVFGCGGDRDKGKRPLMGAVAYRLADFSILTNDNPRREKPEDIFTDILCGIPAAGRCEVIADREEAIAGAMGMAQEGDIVLVAGKGHENMQEFANKVVPFDDREVVQRYFK